MIGDFTDNKGGQVKLILDKLAAKEPLEMTCPPEVDTSVYGPRSDCYPLYAAFPALYRGRSGAVTECG